MIHKSPLPDVEIPDVLLSELVLQKVTVHPDKPALIDGPTGRCLTYGQLDDAARRLAGGLVARGFKPGDVVGIMAPNCPEYAIVFHGVVYAGGTVTTINPTYTQGEVHHHVNIYVNSEAIEALQGLSTTLRDGDEVTIIPALAGGRPA